MAGERLELVMAIKRERGIIDCVNDYTYRSDFRRCFPASLEGVHQQIATELPALV